MSDRFGLYIEDPDEPGLGELVLAETPDMFLIGPKDGPGRFRAVPKLDAVLYRLAFDVPWHAPHVFRPSPVEHEGMDHGG